MRALRRRLALLLLAPSFACVASPFAPAPVEGVVPAPAARAAAEAQASSDTETRYLLAVSSFDRGDYETAAAMFAQLAASLPADASHDQLRHLLVLHAAWSLLGSHDMGLDARFEPSALARAESMLEAYLVHHEQRFPEAAAAREDIYELLGEVQLRHEDAPPPAAQARLAQLTRATYATIQGSDPARTRRRSSNEDRMVRVIEVDTRDIPWATMDNPRVLAFFRSRGDVGVSLMADPFGAFNPTRVLVRGKSERGVMSERSQAILAAARPQLERCYEDALAQGVPLVVHVDVALAWEGGPAKVEIGGGHPLGERGELCVEESLRAAEEELPALALAQPEQGSLHLSFFVQPERRMTRDDLEPKNGLGPGIGPQLGGGPRPGDSDTEW